MHGNIISLEAELILLIIAVVLGVWIMLPDLMVITGLYRIRIRVLGGPSDGLLAKQRPKLRELIEQLEALGFQPLGVYRESVPLVSSVEVFSFVHPRLDCHALVYTLFGADAQACFATVFDDAYAKTTTSPVDEYDEEQLIQRAMPDRPLTELLAQHRKDVEQFADRSRFATNTIEQVVEASQAVYRNPAILRQLKRDFRIILLSKVVLHAIGIVPMLIGAWISTTVVAQEAFLLAAVGWSLFSTIVFIGIRIVLKFSDIPKWAEPNECQHEKCELPDEAITWDWGKRKHLAFGLLITLQCCLGFDMRGFLIATLITSLVMTVPVVCELVHAARLSTEQK